MIELEERARVERPIDECFAYVADFRSSAEWDATAFEARKVTDGAVALGTQFKVRCKLPLGSIEIDYTVTEFEAPHRVVLKAECWAFEGEDEIAFERDGDATEVVYRAVFHFHAPFAHLESLFRGGMERMGKVAIAGLAQALEDDFAPPETSSGAARADRLLWPGLAMFSKLGYRRGRKRIFKPISASLTGKRIIVTGASSGLGLATTQALASRGADLVLVMRNEEKAKRVVADLVEETGNEAIRYEIADLSLMEDVDKLVRRLLREARPIDALINNAGALFNDWRQTAEGIEQSFALLLLSPWRLTRALHPLLAAAGSSRVVNVVSGGMYTQRLNVDRLEASPEGYQGATAYARCKRGLMVVTEEWAKAWAEDGIVVNAMHPGWADTPGVESSLPGFHRITRRILRTPEEGADTIIWLAAATEAADVTGKLFLDREARTTHLLKRTREKETQEERQRLMEFLTTYRADERAAA